MTTKETRPGSSESHVWDGLPAPRTGLPAALAGMLSTALVTALSLAVQGGCLPWRGHVLHSHRRRRCSCVWHASRNRHRDDRVSRLQLFLPATDVHVYDCRSSRSRVAVVFFAVAVAAGSLAGRLREVAEQARQRSGLSKFSMPSPSGCQHSCAGRHRCSSRVGSGTAYGQARYCAECGTPRGSSRSINLGGLPRSARLTGRLPSAVWRRAKIHPLQLRVWPGQQYEFRPVFVRASQTGSSGSISSRPTMPSMPCLKR